LDALERIQDRSKKKVSFSVAEEPNKTGGKAKDTQKKKK